MNRKHVAGATVLIWLLALGWLIQRNYWRPVSAVLAETTLRVPPGATYFAIHAGNHQIGFGASQLDTLRDTIRVQDVTVLQVPTGAQFERVEARTTLHLTRTLELRGFETTVRDARGRFAVRGSRSSDSAMSVHIETENDVRTTDVPVRSPLVLPPLLPLHVAFVDPATLGKRYALQLFDPVSMTVRDLQLTVSAESTIVFPDSAVLDSATALWQPARWDTARTWRLTERVEGHDRHLWVDELGQIVREESQAGYAADRTAFELAFENFQKSRRTAATVDPAAPTIVFASAIEAGVPLPHDNLDELQIRVRGITQEQRDARAPGDAPPHGDSPSEKDRDDRVGTRDSTFTRFTEPSVLVQTADPRIQAQARQIVSRERRPRRQVEMLTQWVFESLEKRSSSGPPSAISVFDSRRGDCDEHTNLFLALARSLGIPARAISGLLYIEGQLYYHSWPEVYISEWVPVDPTLGQVPADARHVRLITGGPVGHLELFKSIGGLSFDVTPTHIGS